MQRVSTGRTERAFEPVPRPATLGVERERRGLTAVTAGSRTSAARKSAAKASGEQAEGEALRMRDLTRASGLPRETVHFYIAQGLLPPGIKTGRNTAEYRTEHLERLLRIRDLQHRHFLPLRAIKALLEDEVAAENLTAEQEALLTRVRATLPDVGRNAQGDVALADVLGGRIDAREIEELREAGLIDIAGKGDAARVSAADAEILRAWAAAREAGIGPERGFRPADLAIYDNAVERLVREEVRRFSRAFAERPTEEATEALEKVLPVIERLLGVLHLKHVRRALAAGEASSTDKR